MRTPNHAQLWPPHVSAPGLRWIWRTATHALCLANWFANPATLASPLQGPCTPLHSSQGPWAYRAPGYCPTGIMCSCCVRSECAVCGCVLPLRHPYAYSSGFGITPPLARLAVQAVPTKSRARCWPPRVLPSTSSTSRRGSSKKAGPACSGPPPASCPAHSPPPPGRAPSTTWLQAMGVQVGAAARALCATISVTVASLSAMRALALAPHTRPVPRMHARAQVHSRTACSRPRSSGSYARRARPRRRPEVRQREGKRMEGETPGATWCMPHGPTHMRTTPRPRPQALARPAWLCWAGGLAACTPPSASPPCSGSAT